MDKNTNARREALLSEAFRATEFDPRDGLRLRQRFRDRLSASWWLVQRVEAVARKTRMLTPEALAPYMHFCGFNAERECSFS